MQKYGREPISPHPARREDGDSEFGDLIEDSEAIARRCRQLHAAAGTVAGGLETLRAGEGSPGLTDGQPDPA